MYSEIQPLEEFLNFQSQNLNLRETINENAIQNVQEEDSHKYELHLQAVIGRKAFTRRNNLFYDYDQRIVY